MKRKIEKNQTLKDSMSSDATHSNKVRHSNSDWYIAACFFSMCAYFGASVNKEVSAHTKSQPH